jgi:hypothetical protein
MCVICGNVGEVPNDIQIRFDLLEKQKEDLLNKYRARTEEVCQTHNFQYQRCVDPKCDYGLCEQCHQFNMELYRLQEQEDSPWKEIDEALQKIDDEQSSLTPFPGVMDEPYRELMGEIQVPVILNDDLNDNPTFGKSITDLPPGEERNEANSQIICAHRGGDGNMIKSFDPRTYDNFEDFFYFHLENMARDCCWSCIEELAVVPPWLDGWDGVIVKMVDSCYTCGKALYDYPGKTWKKVQLSGYRALQCSDCQA